MISPTRWWVASDRIADSLSACCSAAGDRGGERAGRRRGAALVPCADDRLLGAALGRAGEVIARSAFAVARGQGGHVGVETPGQHAAVVLGIAGTRSGW